MPLLSASDKQAIAVAAVAIAIVGLLFYLASKGIVDIAPPETTAAASAPKGVTALPAVSSGLDLVTDPSSTVLIPGVVVGGAINADDADGVASAEKTLVIDMYVDGLPVPAALSTTQSDIVVTGGLGVGVVGTTTANIQFGTAQLPDVCSALRLQYTGIKVDLGNHVPVTRGPSAVLGLAPGKRADGTYTSPALAALQKSGKPVAWSFNVRDGTSGLSFRVPTAPCFPWCWTPMDTSSGRYVIALTPTLRSAPWTHAVLDFSRWTCILPGVGRATGNPVSLRLPSAGKTPSTDDCVLTVRGGDYVDGSTGSSTLAVLGMAVASSGGILAVDLTWARFGHVANIRAPTLTRGIQL